MMQRFVPIVFVMLLVLGSCNRAAEEVPATESPAPAALPAGVTLIETYTGKSGEFSIPYSKYRLDNGLTVILHEDHSDPLVHVDVSFHVGSNREETGRSGFAHFFEHMMFEGSAHVAQGDFSKIISEAGGSLNGTTNSDRTTYYETVPANQLEVALWLEADRMGFLLEAIDEEKFNIQRETVKNERGQRVDNVPYGRTSEVMMQSLYPPGHPYSWPVIGWPEDLDAATLGDVEEFFLRWYVPNNAQLTVGGDFEPAQTLEWVVKYFGPIPRGPEVTPLPRQPAQLDRDRYVTLEDNIHLPAIAILIPTVAYYDPDEAPLDAAAKVLGQGKASLLYQNLVQSGRAVSISASHSCRELACEMAFVVVQNPKSGETLAEMETAIRQTLVEFSERGVNADDLEKFKAEIESGRIFGMQSVSGKVGALAFSEMFNGDPKVAQEDIKRYSAVTAEQVTQSFSRYITGQPAVILSVVPVGQSELAAKPADFTLPEVDTARAAKGDADTTPEIPAISDSFDRGTRPAPGINPVAQLPPIRDTRLANGARMLIVDNPETPTVTLRVVFDMGQRDEPPGKGGLASLTASLMNEASTERSAAEFSDELDRIGASVYISSGQYQTTIDLNTLAKHLDRAVALLMERLMKPAFTEEDFDRIKSQTLESLRSAQKSGPALASRAMSAALAGPDHPLSYPASGLPSTVENITLADVKQFYAAHIPSHLRGVLVSTSLPPEEIDRVTLELGQLPTEPVIREDIDGLIDADGQTIYLVDKPGSAQSSVRIGHPSLPYDALGDYYRAGLMNFALGGTFDSRLNLNLREDKGWTYGAYSGFSGGQEFGSFQFSAEVNVEATGEAVAEALRELNAYSQSGMTEPEFNYMHSSISQGEAMLYETPGSKLGLLAQILIYDLPLDYRTQQQTLLRAIEREPLNELAARLLQPDKAIIVVVGDAAVVKPQLEQLGIPVQRVDEEGFEVAE